MSKNIIIQEGGTGKQMTVNKLRTDQVGGGSCLWVPESETTLVTKHITENGTYIASNEQNNPYGYSQVTVNVPGGNGSANADGTPSTSSGTTPGGSGSAVVGTNPVTGNEEAVGVDEDGNLVTTAIPSSIEIVTPPTKMSYTDGETVSLAGAVVIAKNADGTTWTNEDYPDGQIPAEQLTPSPATAHYASATEQYTDGNGVFAKEISYSEITEGLTAGKWCYAGTLGSRTYGGEQCPATVGGNGYAKLLLTRYNNQVYACRTGGDESRFNLFVLTNDQYRSVGSTTYRTTLNAFTAAAWGTDLTQLPVSTADPTQADIDNMHPSGQNIDVTWKRYGDEKELSSTITITVTEPINSGAGSDVIVGG